ncbi:tetraacyldisaccharide 4'-kinase [Cytophagales bacterium WSM2-2]|nr:tetraacyldisaccharide 4'-kinase [Cytophagales bacterium WSM2-2]
MLLIFLAPFSWLYGAVTSFRNFLYDLGLKRSYSFEPAVLSVGNLNVGGTGKSPMIEYLVRLLSGEYSIAILSRGYGRKTSGFRLASDGDDAASIGDEPFQFHQKFKDKVSVCVCEDRVAGIRALMVAKAPQVILLDDAFQHRRAKPMFSILLTDFSKPFFRDYVLPKGRLREARRGSKRANLVVVTKCNAIPDQVKSEYNAKIQSYSGDVPVFFSEIGYIKPVSLSDATIGKEVVLVTGIANSKPLVEHISKKVNLKFHFEFGDHHFYSPREIEDIQQKAAGFNASILTTEKDMVKLISLELSQAIKRENWFYLPIETRFIDNGSEFDRIVTERIKSHLGNSKN